MNSSIEKIIGHNLERWKRKILRIKGSYYVNLPKPIIVANGKRRGNVIYFIRLYDERKGRILVAIDFG